VTRYPRSFDEIDSWAEQNGVLRGEAIRRFVQFVTLESIGEAALGQHAALKGGNALRFVDYAIRSTVDLDYTVDSSVTDTEQAVREAIGEAVNRGYPRYGIKGRVQRTQRRPKTPGTTFPTYDVTIGFQLPWDKHFVGFESLERPLSTVVEVELSLNDVVCETRLVTLEGGEHVKIRVCSLEDIVAEKLRALLQQVVRDRYRPQDVYDIAYVRGSSALNLEKIGAFLVEKCRARGIEPHRNSFNEDVRTRAEKDYGSLKALLGRDFVPFEEAWASTLELVRELPISNG